MYCGGLVMNYGSSSVNFAGRVDKSVYQWAKIAKREAKEGIIDEANYRGTTVSQEELDAVDKRADAMMKVLEAKAAVMHPDTVITVDQPIKAYRDRFLCVHNDKLDHDLRQVPVSRTDNETWERLDRWKVAGRDADQYVKGENIYRGKFGGYDGPRGTQTLGLLEYRINDIDETRTDRRLFNEAVEYAVKCSKSGSSKSLQKQVDNILSVQKDLGYKSDFVKDVDANRKATDEKRALWKQNEEMRKKMEKAENPGFFQRIASFFS